MSDYANNGLLFGTPDATLGAGPLKVTSVTAGASATLPLVNGRKTVTTAGTDEALVASSTACSYVIATGLRTNTDIVCLGAAGVDAASSTRTGIPLSAGQSVGIPISDLNKLYIDAVVSGEGVAFCYFK